MVPGALALALFASPLYAATDADLAEIRDQIRQLKETYEARIQALEQRLKDDEAKSGRAPPEPAAAPAPPPPVAVAPAASISPSGSTGGGLSAFNPAI